MVKEVGKTHPQRPEANQLKALKKNEKAIINESIQKEAVNKVAEPIIVEGPVIVRDSALKDLKKRKITQKGATSKKEKIMVEWIKDATSEQNGKHKKPARTQK